MVSLTTTYILMSHWLTACTYSSAQAANCIEFVAANPGVFRDAYWAGPSNFGLV